MVSKFKLYTSIWLFLVLGVFSMPLIEEITGWIRIDPLRGKFANIDEPEFSIATWFSGEYQHDREFYLQQKFDLRNFLVRLNTQFNYSCFGVTCDGNMIVGKDNYIFNHDVLVSYYGDDLLKEDTLRKELEKLKFVQDTLEKLNKNFVFVIAPSKPPFCFDKIPATHFRERKITNYELYVKYLKELGIHYIDYRTYFFELKKQTPYLLFPPKGLHWSIYSTSYVIDSLVHYIEVKKKTKLATYKWSSVKMEDAKENDIDVEHALNLLYTLESPQLAYRKLELEKKHNDSLKIITIGDSFYGELFYNGLNEILPESNEFWFYGRFVKAHDYDPRHEKHFYQLNLKHKIDETDVLIMLYNDANLKRMGFNMIDRLYRLFTHQSLVLPVDDEYRGYINTRIEKFKSDPDKINEIKLKAIEHKISLDSMIEVEATIAVEYDVWTSKIKLKK